MSAIDFQVNEFRTYEVKVEGLSLGFINTGQGGYTPSLGEKIQYDGTTVILKDGREFPDVPQLRTAILKSNWLVPVGDKVTRVRPKSANIKVSPTETRGGQRPVKTTVELQTSDEREVVSISERKRQREATNLEATRRVPLESQEAKVAVAKQIQIEKAGFQSTGDSELDGLLVEIDNELYEYRMAQTLQSELEKKQAIKRSRQAKIEAEVESDIMDMLEWAEQDDPAPPTPTPRTTKTPVTTRPTARQLPVDMQDERKTMPIVREDPTENAGTVVGNVGDQKRTVIEREEEIALNVAQAKPEQQSPAPKPRFGGTGAIVVDEQRDMGAISLSSEAAPIRLDESAKVISGSQESIKMGDAQVGRKTASPRPSTEVDGGVAVGRIMSPTKRSFVASDANTSSSAIQRAQEGKQLRVEKYETDEEVVGNVSDGAPAQAVATGDVQEVKSGDTLEEVLPDAATPPKPEVHRRPEEDPAYQAVKMIIPDFEWDKDRPVKVRVQAALKHIKNPQYVKGILAVETELAREEIKKALAAEIKKRSEAKNGPQEPENAGDA